MQRFGIRLITALRVWIDRAAPGTLMNGRPSAAPPQILAAALAGVKGVQEGLTGSREGVREGRGALGQAAS